MVKNIIQTLFTRGFTAGINFLILIISSKFLGVNTRGEISLFILNIATIQIISEIYTGSSIVYFVPKFNLKKMYLYGIIWTMAACAVSNGVLFLIHKEMTAFESDLFILSVLIILNTFNNVIILAKENIKLFNFLGVLQPSILLIGIFYFTQIEKDFTFKAYIIPLYISFLVSFVISFTRVFKYISIPDFKTKFSLKSVLENGFFCQVAVLLHLLSNRFSFYILGSNALVGLYATASSLMESVWIIANGITPIILSKISNTGDTSFTRRITLTFAKISFLLSCLATVFVWLLPNSLFIYLLGNNFQETKHLMLFISPGILFISFSTVISHYFSGLGNLKFIAICNFSGFIFTLILAPLLIKKYGLHGAAISANITYLISSVALSIGFFVKTKISLLSLFRFKEDSQNIKEAF